MPTHTASARKAFDIAGRSVHPALIHAFGAVKLACCRGECGAGIPDAAGRRRHRHRRARSRRRHARRRARARRAPGRRRHGAQPGGERGHRRARAGARRRRPRRHRARQRAPVDQRHVSHRAAHRRHPRRARARCGAGAVAGIAPGAGTALGGCGVRRPHGTDGCRPPHHGAQIRRLGRGGEPRPLAGVEVRGTPARGEPRRHRHRHRHGRAAPLHLSRRRTAAAGHRPQPRPGGKPHRGDAERRRLHRGRRHPRRVRDQPDEDRRRPAPLGQWPARRPGRDHTADADRRQLDHAGQGEPGDSRSRHAGRAARTRPPAGDRARLRARLARTQSLPAADRRRAARPD